MPRAMSVELLDEAMKAQLALEWDRLRKALSQAGDTGDLNLEEVRVVADRDRRGLPPAVSVAAVQGALKLEKSSLRVQAFRSGEETKDPTMRLVAKAQAHEIRIQDVDHSEVYAALAYHVGKRLGLNESQAAVFGDAVAYLLTGWMQAHGDSNRADRAIYEVKTAAARSPACAILRSARSSPARP